MSGAATQRKATDRAKIPSVKREAVFLAVHRYEDSVYYRRLEKETFLLLRGLRSGASVAVAASQAFAKSKLTPDAQASLLQESFAHASQLGRRRPINEASLELADSGDVGQKEEASLSEELEPRNGDITLAYVLLRVTLVAGLEDAVFLRVAEPASQLEVRISRSAPWGSIVEIEGQQVLRSIDGSELGGGNNAPFKLTVAEEELQPQLLSK